MIVEIILYYNSISIHNLVFYFSLLNIITCSQWLSPPRGNTSLSDCFPAPYGGNGFLGIRVDFGLFLSVINRASLRFEKEH
mgnify:CR=1 FL=1